MRCMILTAGPLWLGESPKIHSFYGKSEVETMGAFGMQGEAKCRILLLHWGGRGNILFLNWVAAGWHRVALRWFQYRGSFSCCKGWVW